MTDQNNEHMRKIAELRADHRKKVADIKKKRFTRLITNIIVIVIVLTAAGVGMSSIGYTRVFAFMVVALLPSIAGSVTDRRPGRFASKTVMAFNIAGMSPHVASIAYSGSPNQTALAIMQEVDTWILVYGFACFGWAVVFIIPYITALYLEIKAAYTVKKLKQFKQDLVEEWGDEIKN